LPGLLLNSVLLRILLLIFAAIKTISMSLFNTNKNKDKKKGSQPSGKPGFTAPKGKSNSKAAAKNTRITGRSQRGS